MDECKCGSIYRARTSPAPKQARFFMTTWAAQKIMGAKCAGAASVVKREHRACPGRGAAFFLSSFRNALFARARNPEECRLRLDSGSAREVRGRPGMTEE